MSEKSSVFIERTGLFNIINGVGKSLRAVGLDPFKLNASRIIEDARKKTGFQGPLPGQTEVGMQKMLQSISSQAQINAFGSLALKNLFERTMISRLKVQQTLDSNPEILQQPITNPVFIIGMPRTGTTILHALLHQDPAHRSPLAWECLLPHPASTPSNFTNNENLATVRKEFDQLFKLVPDFQKKHYMEADSPQECLGINALDFNTFQVCAQVYVPAYISWFSNQADRLETMHFHKSFLQFLQSGGVKANRWLLKSPVHLMRLPELFEVYPDAQIIMTHRHPAKVVPSASSLISSVRSLYSDHEDPVRSGQEQAAIWSRYFERFIEDRKKLNKEDQIIDLKFEDFVKDQLAVTRKIYKHFGWEFSTEVSQRFSTFLQANPKDKHGAHNYTLADFNLTEEGIESQFSTYLKFLETI